MTGARPRPGGRPVAASRSWLGALLAGSAALAGAACAHPQGGPAEALADFGGAVDRKDYPAAYALMTADYRRRVPLADFRRELEAGGPDVATVARRLRDQAARTPFEIEVEIDLGQKLTMVLEAGQWRVATQPFDLASQETPRAALRSFVRAVELRRYDALLRLIPNRYRVGVSIDKLRDYWEGEHRADNQKVLQALRAHINAPIVETGDEARMPYDEATEVRFLREDGVWKIEDVD